MSQRRLSPTNTTSDLGAARAVTAWSNSLREGLMLEVSEENTVVAKRWSTPARANSSSQGPLRDRMFATRPSRCPAARRVIARAYSSGMRPNSRSEEHTSELQSHSDLVCRLLLEKKKTKNNMRTKVS